MFIFLNQNVKFVENATEGLWHLKSASSSTVYQSYEDADVNFFKNSGIEDFETNVSANSVFLDI